MYPVIFVPPLRRATNTLQLQRPCDIVEPIVAHQLVCPPLNSTLVAHLEMLEMNVFQLAFFGNRKVFVAFSRHIDFE